MPIKSCRKYQCLVKHHLLYTSTYNSKERKNTLSFHCFFPPKKRHSRHRIIHLFFGPCHVVQVNRKQSHSSMLHACVLFPTLNSFLIHLLFSPSTTIIMKSELVRRVILLLLGLALYITPVSSQSADNPAIFEGLRVYNTNNTKDPFDNSSQHDVLAISQDFQTIYALNDQPWVNQLGLFEYVIVLTSKGFIGL